MTFSDGVTQLALAKNLGVSRAQVRTLIDKGIFKVDTNDYNSLSVLKKEISDNNIKIIYSEIVN